MPRPFKVRPFDGSGGPWITSRHRYYEYAESSLEDLIKVVVEVNRLWPTNTDSRLSADFLQLIRKRDRLSDSTLLFAAIAVESFMNFYGVTRLGEKQFNRQIERLSTQRKVEILLLICDGIELDESEPLLLAVKSVVEHRNRLAHPKTRRIPAEYPKGTGTPVPEAAVRAVAEMKKFFVAFAELVPTSRHLLATELGAGPV